MLTADIFRPDQWHDFFVMVGGAAAALTGLVFVALSLNLEIVVRDATHLHRAIGTLTNFAGIFVLCALALMGGQNHVAIGTEWLLVSTGAGALYVNNYAGAARWREPGNAESAASRGWHGVLPCADRRLHHLVVGRDGWLVHRRCCYGEFGRLLGFGSLDTPCRCTRC
jgi:hypothetical protein